jgi:hypothetical protein
MEKIEIKCKAGVPSLDSCAEIEIERRESLHQGIRDFLLIRPFTKSTITKNKN